MRIELCGGIASGKTSFASLLSKIGTTQIFESFEINPFWGAFYSDPSKYAFETEISFTLQHYHQVKKQYEDKPIVCDYSFLLDLAYAEMGLSGSQLDTFRAVYQEIQRELPPPSLIIHLQCEPEIELSRIRARGRDVEKNISVDFLKSLNKAVMDQINLVKNDLTILTIDSARNNFIDDENVKNELLELVSSYSTLRFE